MSRHKTVLLNETIESLNIHDGATILDATFGGGGHSREICKRFPGTKIIALDQDIEVKKNVPAKILSGCEIIFHNTNFRNLDTVLKEEGIQKIDGIIFDLGFSSDQLESSGRGFSFLKDEPLLMTLKVPAKDDLTAYEIVNNWEEKNLADIIYGYGEEKFSRSIARGIVEARGKGEIKTTGELVKIIEAAVPGIYKRGKINPATKTFQALRIATNDELGALSHGLQKGFEALKENGRMAVISFHSLEDRIVKKFFKQLEKEGSAKLINKKPIVPGTEELAENKRARSAKLRVLTKL